MAYPYPSYTNPFYNPFMPATNQGYQVQPQQPVNGIVKVNGRDSALQYQLPPNSMSPALFDNNGKVFYVVSTDGTGAKTVETFDFSPHVDEEPLTVNGAEFVSRDEFDKFTAKVNAALGAIENGLHESVPAKSAAKPARQGKGAQADG
ncbi:MAG: hypothetical protein IJG82_09275 [Atopobiaceae bacterium]|nr:hypothetical protein [Atopobiaceae bacterium]